MQLGLTTWYMGEASHRNMSLRDYARVYVPAYGIQHKLVIFGSAQYTGSVKCSLSRYGKRRSGTKKTVAENVKLYSYAVTAGALNNAQYVFNCSATYLSEIDNQVRAIGKIKTIELVFVKG